MSLPSQSLGAEQLVVAEGFANQRGLGLRAAGVLIVYRCQRGLVSLGDHFAEANEPRPSG